MHPSWQDPPQYRGGGAHFAMPSMTPVVKALIIANVGVSLVLWLFFSQGMSIGDGGYLRPIQETLAISPDAWRDWFPLLPLWQLVTYGFLHGDLFHLLGNMLFLYFLGTMLEGIVGSRRFAVLYGAALVVAGAAQLLFALLFTNSALVLGASGAVLAVVCATATLRPQTQIIFIIVPMTLKTLAILFVAMDVFRVLMELKGAGGNVAALAHLSGAAVGFLAVRRGWIWKDPVEHFDRWRERLEDEKREDDAERLDELLEKINRHGISSLSGRERAFLKRVSKRR